MTISLTKKSIAHALHVKPYDVEITDHRLKVAKNGDTLYWMFPRFSKTIRFPLGRPVAIDRNFTRRDMEE